MLLSLDSRYVRIALPNIESDRTVWLATLPYTFNLANYFSFLHAIWGTIKIYFSRNVLVYYI